MKQVETNPKSSEAYINPLANTDQQVFHNALTQDRGKKGRIEDEYLAASLNRKFEYANFSRDFMRTARDAHDFDPEIRSMVIRNAVRHMAFKRDDLTEAQVGRVHHEHRRNKEGSRSKEFVDIFNTLQSKWSHAKRGKQSEQLTYYGAVDTTPDFFSIVVEEYRIHPEILRERVDNQDLKRKITVAKAARAAIGWTTHTILYGPPPADQDDRVKAILHERKLDNFLPFYENQVLRRIDGLSSRLRELQRRLMNTPREYLLESQRVNKDGLVFQNITDGNLSTMHTSGELKGLLGNYHKPIAYLEVQVGAIQALQSAAQLYPRKAAFYEELARKVRESTLRQFYMPNEKYFAAAVDRDEITGAHRQVEALSIMGASILNSDIFDSMPEQERRTFIEPIVERLFSGDFITDAGLRTKAKQHASLITDPDNPLANAAESQGSWTVWPALNEDIIFGLRRQGFHELAEQLENRLVNMVHANSNMEYAFVVPGNVTLEGKQVNLDGLVAQNYKTKQEFSALTEAERAQIVGDRHVIFISAPYPQGDQLWTASAVERILYEREHNLNQHTIPHSWQHTIEQNIVRNNEWKNIPLLKGDQLAEFGDNNYFFVVDPDEATRIEKELLAASERKRASQRRNT